MNDYTNLISPQNKVFFEETYNMELSQCFFHWVGNWPRVYSIFSVKNFYLTTGKYLCPGASLVAADKRPNRSSQCTLAAGNFKIANPWACHCMILNSKQDQKYPGLH